MTIINELFADLTFLAPCAVVAALLISTTFYMYPDIIRISRSKGLMDVPGERKIHAKQIPTLGGLGVFIAFTLSVIVFGTFSDLIQPDLIKLLALIGSTIILLFLGMKDDLISMSPKKKFIGQLIAVFNVVVLTDVRILNFEGLLGIGELPYLGSVLFSIFVFVLVINALNLIDGIDGLAACVGIISSTSFGIFFLLNGHFLMTLTSSILVGALIGFLRYNLSSDLKIFMGDCGSMLVGFLMAYQGICFLTLNGANAEPDMISNAPIMLLAIFSYPLFDLLRVFAIRIKQKKSPFSADSNHIHHRLLRLGLNHKRATLLLCACNIFIIGFTFLLTDLNIHIQLITAVFAGSFLYLLPFSKVFDTYYTVNTESGVKGKFTRPVRNFEANDTFEFDLKPMNLFGKSKKTKNVKGIPVSSDHGLDKEVVVQKQSFKTAIILDEKQDSHNLKEETIDHGIEIELLENDEKVGV